MGITGGPWPSVVVPALRRAETRFVSRKRRDRAFQWRVISYCIRTVPEWQQKKGIAEKGEIYLSIRNGITKHTHDLLSIHINSLTLIPGGQVASGFFSNPEIRKAKKPNDDRAVPPGDSQNRALRAILSTFMRCADRLKHSRSPETNP
jgi:hypothetical protein